MNKIKSTFIILFSLLIVCLIIVLLSFLELAKNRMEFGKSQIGQFHTIKISDQVREKNEELSHQCLNYIITGDTIWLNAYERISEKSIYRFPSRRKGFELLKDSLRRLGFGKDEYLLLEEAIKLSTLLNEMEADAMHFIKNNGETLYQNQQELALGIISGSRYLSTKQALISTIQKFEKNVEDQTNQIRQTNIKQGMRLYYQALSFLALIIVFAVFTFYLIWIRLKRQEKQDILFKQGVDELKITQSKLLTSEERFILAVKGAGTIIWDYDINKNTLCWSPNDANIFGFLRTEIETSIEFIYSRIHSDDLERFKQHLQNHIIHQDPLNIDVRLYEKRGELKWYRCRASSSRDTDGLSNRIVGVFSDITESVKREEKHRSAILETEDRERSRIAREIHDSLQQTMSTALLNFEKVRSSILFTDDQIAEKYQNGYSFLKKAISESRTLAHNLIPQVVDQKGIAEAIDNLVSALKGSTTIKIEFYTNLDQERLQVAVEMTIYRIVQEAINNAIKYSMANECIIQLLKHKNTLTLTVEDDGIGFDNSQMNDTFGLNSMQTRAEAIGAYFEIVSSPGHGTQLLLELTG
nr:PAS domain-containing protein [uncultured Carboxylicivirga sp.]